MIRGVAHIGVAVRSIDEARKLYETMGLAIDHIEEVPAEQVRVAMIPCGTTHIELLEPTDPASPIARFLDQRGPGIHHVCLDSDDLTHDDQALRTGGYRLLRDQPTAGAGGSLVQFVHPASTGGVLLELAQPNASAQPRE